MEDLVHEWVELNIQPAEADKRQQALIEHGFTDILDQEQELNYILNCYTNTVVSNSNIQLTKMHIGGAEPLRVLKLEFKAIMPSVNNTGDAS